MLIKDLMTAPAITVTAGTTIKDGLRLLDTYGVTALPVIDSDGFIVGVVSEADLLRGVVLTDGRAHMRPVFDPQQHPRIVEDVMSAPPLTVAGDSDLSEAVAIMTSTAVKSLPVVKDGRVVGVVSRSDVVHVMARSDEDIRADVAELLRDAGLVCVVTVNDGGVRLSRFEDPAQARAAEVVARSVKGVMAVDVLP